MKMTSHAIARRADITGDTCKVYMPPLTVQFHIDPPMSPSNKNMILFHHVHTGKLCMHGVYT